MNPLEFLGNIFNTVFFAPVVNILVYSLQFLQNLGIPGALGWIIILLTVVVRLLVWPLMSQQMKNAKKMQELKPHLDELKKKHDKDKQALATAQAALYKEHGINPAAGCAPTILQVLVVAALYQSIPALFNGQAGLDHINYFLYSFVPKLVQSPDPLFLGINLSLKPQEVFSTVPLLLLIPILTAVLQFIQSKMMLPTAVKEYSTDSKVEKKEKEELEDTMTAVQSQMVFMMPLMIGYFSFVFPVGVALFWNIMTLLSIVQQYRISGWGGIKPWLTRFSN